MLLWLLLSPAWAAPPPSPTPSAQELLDRNLEARGGADKLAAIQSMRFEGHLIAGGGAQRLVWAETLARPDHVRQELTRQGLTHVDAWDGKTCWEVNPFGGRRQPQRISPDDAKGLIEQAVIGGALQDARENGYPVHALGTEDVDGTFAYKLEVDRPGGDLQYVWLDPDAFLTIRMLSRRTYHGAIVESQFDYSDYEQVAGVYFPLLIEQGARGSDPASHRRIQIDRATPNVEVDPAVFAFPQTEGGTDR